MKKFSILVANYNNGTFFKTCYDSIISQKYPHFEVIILDDASTDNSLEVISEMIGNDDRFKIFTNEQNSGVGITKARLIELASGEYCGFCDPDDALSPDALHDAVDVFSKDENTVLVYSNFYDCDEHLQPRNISKASKPVPSNDPYFFNCPIHMVHFVAFRKDIYETTSKMDTSKKIAEDQDLYLKMYEKGKVQFIDKPNYYYRKHSGGISQNENKQKSYDYWAEVIFNAMKRRGLTKINGQKIPAVFSNSHEIFDLLAYQNKLPFRLKKKVKILIQNIFS